MNSNQLTSMLAVVFTLAYPGFAEGAKPIPVGIQEIADDTCPDQVSTCAEIPSSSWPQSNFRMGFTLMLEGNLMPFRWNAAGFSQIWKANLPLGLDIGFGGTDWRTSLILAPLTVQIRPDDTFRSLFGYNMYLTGGWRGIHAAIGSPDFDWSGNRNFKISKTTFGLSLVVARLPKWGNNLWFPEWRR